LSAPSLLTVAVGPEVPRWSKQITYQLISVVWFRAGLCHFDSLYVRGHSAKSTLSLQT